MYSINHLAVTASMPQACFSSLFTDADSDRLLATPGSTSQIPDSGHPFTESYSAITHLDLPKASLLPVVSFCLLNVIPQILN
jgi:hypothetical protein